MGAPNPDVVGLVNLLALRHWLPSNTPNLSSVVTAVTAQLTELGGVITQPVIDFATIQVDQFYAAQVQVNPGGTLGVTSLDTPSPGQTLAIGPTNAGQITLGTGGIARVTIDSSGRVLIVTTALSSGFPFEVINGVSISFSISSSGRVVFNTASLASGIIFDVQNNGTSEFNVGFQGAVTSKGAMRSPQLTALPTNGGTVATDASTGNSMTVIAGAGVASFTVNAPTNPATGQFFTYIFENASGGALTTNFNAVFKLAGAWTSAATGNERGVTFLYDGTSWREVSRNAADVPL